jgi:(2Fe-2S) ferredoxin
MKVTAYLCTGSDCKRRKDERRAIKRALRGKAYLVEVGCQKICKGQVVGIARDGELRWYRRVNSKSLIKALRRVVRGRKVSDELAVRHVKKRDDKLR